MRQYTVEEANAQLPTLTAILEDLQRLRARMLTIAQMVTEFELRAAQNGHGEGSDALNPENDLRDVRAEMEQRLLYLQGLGIQLKDIENGIVDFPSRMFGRDVYLCWRLGEEQVAHWHDMEAGFAGRRPL
jgi:hypothetical protein